MHGGERKICTCRAMDIKLAALKASADLTRQWLVVDLDAFFASVEELDDPSLVSAMLPSLLVRLPWCAACMKMQHSEEAKSHSACM